MERNGFLSAIITVVVGLLLATGNPAGAAEQTPAQAANPAVTSEKTVEKEKTAVDAGSAVEKKTEAQSKTSEDETKQSGETVFIRLKIPFFSPLVSDVPLASVADDKITVQDLRDAVTAVHEKMTAEQETPVKKSFLDTLQRLINVKLVIQEARNIELDKLPEIKEDLEKNREMILRQVLFQDHVKDVKADEKEVDALYRDMIREWKLKSVLFKKETDAKGFEDAIKAGKSFDELRKKALKEGSAEEAGQNEESYANKAALGPVIWEAVKDLKAGSVSPLIHLQNLFLILKVEDVRSVENPELKEKARSQVLSRLRLESLNKFKDDLYKKYVKQDAKLIKRIDFEAKKPGLAKLLKDKRTIVTVRGEKPITIAELAEAVKDKYYHGVENAIIEKKVNREKLPILDELISKRVFRRAALDKGLENSKDYRYKIAQYQDTVLFGTFIEKVVKPDITISYPEVEAYYNDHKSDYVFPQMMQIEDIVFKKREDAQTAIDKLRKGMDFKWLKNNADRQVAGDAQGLLQFGEQTLSVKSFPEQLQKVLDGARTGDYRLFESPEGYNYVLFIAKEVPSRTQTLEEVKNDVAQKVSWNNLNKALEEWFKKLREAYPVKIFLQEQ